MRRMTLHYHKQVEGLVCSCVAQSAQHCPSGALYFARTSMTMAIHSRCSRSACHDPLLYNMSGTSLPFLLLQVPDFILQCRSQLDGGGPRLIRGVSYMM